MDAQDGGVPTVPVLCCVLSALCGTGVVACGPSGRAAVAVTAADRAFLQDMQPHHKQAIAAAQLAVTRAGDPRVRTFAQRIVAEQTPELTRMQAATSAAHLSLDLSAGADMAVHRISAQQLTALGALRGLAFDRQFLTLSISSEQGAVEMATAEVAGGRDAAAVAIARPISGADHSEIPQLQALLAQLG